ncbi:flavin adenine dinucleotide transporter [Starmerella bacillaris]|uniref:Flavin adenine dinucleotide transporter n=1 Tax=Starmerella bacillaris TaxID=1247836 RepID=A0AAV5RJU6_STABA|nr:flavin adenine dinucleotide transporter [Starmerella bacillaris]
MDNFVAGALAGAITTIAMHPLELAKTRLQLGHSASLKSSLGEMRRGSLVAAYRGLLPNLIGNAVAWGAYFYAYETVQRFAFGPPLNLNKSAQTYLYCSFVAGILTQVATNPIWVIKTQILGAKSGDKEAPSTIGKAAALIYRKWGIGGFWRGFVPGTMGTVQSAIYFGMYSPMKPYLKQRLGLSDTATYFISSAFCKLVSATLMYPHQVVKSQMQYTGVSMGTAISEILSKDGWKGFYRGLSANLARVVPAMTVTLVTYENLKKLLA